MKRFVFILMFVLTVLCGVNLIFNSSNIKIDYSKLQLRDDYDSVYDEFPEDKIKEFTLYRKADENKLNIDFSGSYHREKATLETLNLLSSILPEDISVNYIWQRYSTSNTNDIIICFVNRTFAVVHPNENTGQFFDKSYNDGILTITDDANQFDMYECHFNYLAKSDDEHNVSNIILKNTQNNSTENEDISLIKSIVKKVLETFVDWSLENSYYYILLALIAIVFFCRASLLVKKYKKALSSSLFPEEHTWFGNNSPNDLYVSVKIFKKGKYTEYNLLDYFSNNLLSNPQAYALLGNAGEGKTFSLSRIALGILRSFNYNKNQNKQEYLYFKKKIPIILNFSELADCKGTDDIIANIYNKMCKTIKPKKRLRRFSAKRMIPHIEKRLNKGDFIVLIDGYDEISNPDLRMSFSKVLINFMNEFSNCHYVITSRIHTYGEERFSNIPSEKTLYLSPLSKEQIREFILKWTFPVNKSGTELYQRIINTSQIEKIVTNPLLLTMITHIYSDNDFVFSNSKVDLYRQCCECLLKKWEEKKSFIKRLKRYTTLKDINVKVELLSLMAYYLYNNQTSYINNETLFSLWGNHPYEKTFFHGKTKDVLEDMIEQSGLIEGTNENSVRFRHRSFYEYFLALYFVNNKEDFDELYAKNKTEKNILFFYLAMVEDDKPVVDFIIHQTHELNLIQDILIERKILNDNVIYYASKEILDSLNYEDINCLQQIGYIAQQYPKTSSLIKNTLLSKLSYSYNEQIKTNIIITLMLFCDRNSLSPILKKFFNIEQISYLVRYSGELINDMAQDIIEIIDNYDTKVMFVECLAKSYRFEAVYNIYVNKQDVQRDLAIIGFLQMSKDPLLLEWLRAKKFNLSVNDNVMRKVHSMYNKYGWIDSELDEIDRDNLFLLIYLGKEIIKKNNRLNNEMIDNKIAFLISYIISDEIKSIFYELISIPGVKFSSVIEFDYHWNKRKKRSSVLKQNKIIEIPVLNKLIILIISLAMFLKSVIYLGYTNKIFVISYEGWNITFDELSVFSTIPLNSIFLLFSFGIYFVNWRINALLKNTKYNKVSICLSYIFSMFFALVYMAFIKSFVFRIILIISLLLISFLEVLKHRNNYPSFKEPQFSKIINYLE